MEHWKYLLLISIFFYSCTNPSVEVKATSSIIPPATIPDTSNEPPEIRGNTYYVNKGGDDANGGSNRDNDACLTIQKGISLLQPGDGLLIGEGIYTDVANDNEYLTAGTPGTMGGDSGVQSFNIIMDRSGTENLPIVIMADPENTHQVVIDGEHHPSTQLTERAGIFLYHQDYIHFYGLTIRNCRKAGFLNWDHSGTVPMDDEISIGVCIENCEIYNIHGHDNVAGIAMWSTKDWVVRNNYIHHTNAGESHLNQAHCIQSYGTINALVINNLLEHSSNGIFWKDHYVSDEINRVPLFESEICYNRINVSQRGFWASIQGSGTAEAGANYIHHNIITVDDSPGNFAINVGMAAAGFRTTGTQRIESNICIGGNGRDSSGLVFSGTTDVQISGNIIHGFSYGIVTRYSSEEKPNQVNYLDYNIYGDNGPFDISNYLVLFDRYSEDDGIPKTEIKDIETLQAASMEDIDSLNVRNPAMHSTQSPIDQNITSLIEGDFTPPQGSPVLGFMEDGSNAGAYQLGDEIIGVY